MSYPNVRKAPFKEKKKMYKQSVQDLKQEVQNDLTKTANYSMYPFVPKRKVKDGSGAIVLQKPPHYSATTAKPKPKRPPLSRHASIRPTEVLVTAPSIVQENNVVEQPVTKTSPKLAKKKTSTKQQASSTETSTETIKSAEDPIPIPEPILLKTNENEIRKESKASDTGTQTRIQTGSTEKSNDTTETVAIGDIPATRNESRCSSRISSGGEEDQAALQVTQTKHVHAPMDSSGVAEPVKTARSVSVAIHNQREAEKIAEELTVGTTKNFLSVSHHDGIDKRRVSYIMQEKLKSLTVDLHRRTTQMKKHVKRPPTPEEDDASSIGDEESKVEVERKRSLNSFIGLDKGGKSASASGVGWGTEEGWKELPLWKRIVKHPFWKRFRLPESIDRTSRKYLVWLSIVSVCFLYNVYGIPLRSSYPYQTESNLVYWLCMDYFCDLIYLLDMVIVKPRMRYNRGGLSIKTPKEMKLHYLHSVQFKLDLVALLPLDVFYIVTGPVPLLRSSRVFKIMSYWECFHLLDSLVSNPLILRIAKTLSYMVYIIHCNSCIYYTFSSWEGFGKYGFYPDGIEGEWQPNKWVYDNNGAAYMRCFYFTTKLATSIGNNPPPTNVVENLWVTFSWLMGVFVFAVLLGQIRDIVATATRNREEFRKKMDISLQHIKQLKVPQELQDKVRDWFIYTWQQQKTLDENQLIDKLPLKLQTDLALSVHYETLSKVQLFQDCDKALLRDLVLKLKPVLFLPGDFVCKKGEVGKEMYIVNKGMVDVVGGPEGKTIFVTLKEGSVFGEISLLALAGGNKRTADVKSRGFANLFLLSKDDLHEILKDYPDAQKSMKRKAKKLIKKTNAREGEKEGEVTDLKKIATLSTNIPTPKMLQTVMKVLHPETKTAQDLKTALEEEGDADRPGSEMSSMGGGEFEIDPLKLHEHIANDQKLVDLEEMTPPKRSMSLLSTPSQTKSRKPLQPGGHAEATGSTPSIQEDNGDKEDKEDKDKEDKTDKAQNE